MPKKLSKISPRSEETAVQANARAALRNEVAVKNLTTGHTVGEAEAGGTEASHEAMENDPMPEGKG